MVKLKKYGHWYFLGALALAAYAVWQAVFWAEVHRGRVFLRVFDVGQGDAILTSVTQCNSSSLFGCRSPI